MAPFAISHAAAGGKKIAEEKKIILVEEDAGLRPSAVHVECDR